MEKTLNLSLKITYFITFKDKSNFLSKSISADIKEMLNE